MLRAKWYRSLGQDSDIIWLRTHIVLRSFTFITCLIDKIIPFYSFSCLVRRYSLFLQSSSSLWSLSLEFCKVHIFITFILTGLWGCQKKFMVRPTPISRHRPARNRILPRASRTLSRKRKTPKVKNKPPKPTSPRPIFCKSVNSIMLNNFKYFISFFFLTLLI